MKTFFLIFTVLVFSNTAIAQRPAIIYSENFQQIATTYQQVKENLPAYFFTYGLGGFNETEEGYITENAMQARSYVVPMPVLITGDKNLPPYDLWLRQLFANENAKAVGPNQTPKMTYEEKISLEQARNPRDSAQIAKDEQFRKEKIETAEKLAKQRESANGAKTPVNEKSSKKEVKKDKPTAQASVDSIFNPYNPIPDSVQSKINEMGSKAGYLWLYNQQIIAGNVIFCSPKTATPIALNIETPNAEKDYMKLLEVWKKAYSSIWKKSNLEQHIAIAETFDTYFSNYGKSSSVGFNFDDYMYLYKQELNAALAK
jgi:hypothetical protein